MSEQNPFGREGAQRRAFLAATLAAGTTAAVAATPGPSRPGPRAGLGQRSLDTRLTREYGVRLPLVGAGMGFISTPALVAAVSNAGGIGVLGNAIEPPPGTQALIQQIKLATSKLFGVDFIVDDSAFGPATTDAHIDVCIAEQVKLVVFHMNVPPKEWVDRLQAAGARVWMQAGSVKQAFDAAILGIDAVVAQGSEAGGHDKSKVPGPLLLSQIIKALPSVLVLAAGGIADGEAVFRALSSGAQGVWVGDFEAMGMPAGDGARLIHDIQPAARIVATMMNDARLLFEKERTRAAG